MANASAHGLDKVVPSPLVQAAIYHCESMLSTAPLQCSDVAAVESAGAAKCGAEAGDMRGKLSMPALFSIRSTVMTQRLKLRAKLGHRREEIHERIARGDETITDIAAMEGLPPWTLARAAYSKRELGDPEVHAGSDKVRQEIEACRANDWHVSPDMDRVKRMVGMEYEMILMRQLEARGIRFQSEDELRDGGYSKTPDVLLICPIGVRGRIVNWIDSKAMFGDPMTHRSNLDQLKKYVHRLGPGMVIYWFGICKSLINDERDIDLLSSLRKGDSATTAFKGSGGANGSLFQRKGDHAGGSGCSRGLSGAGDDGILLATEFPSSAQQL